MAGLCSLDLINSLCVFQEIVLVVNSTRNCVSIAVGICLPSYVICMSDVYVLLLIHLKAKFCQNSREEN